MFAIAFDLVTANVASHHPVSISKAYSEIARVMGKHGFEWIQGSVYLSRSDNLVALSSVMEELKVTPWFPLCVRDVRGFRVEDWSDFTDFVKRKP